MRRGGRVLLGLVPLFGALGIRSALAAPPEPTTVDLGAHQFGHLATPEAIVAVAGADEVGFENPGEGSANGPWSFDVGADGSVWLLDEINARLLRWDAGRPDHPAEFVPLPEEVVRAAADFALGPDGTIYLSYLPQAPNSRHTLQVGALSLDGDLLWSRDTDIEVLNSVVRAGPDGTMYWAPGFGTNDWTPFTTAAGEPLSLEQQRAGTRPDQPVADSLALSYEQTSEQLGRATLTDGDGMVLEAWDLTSDTSLGGILATSGLVDGDPILTLGVFDETPDDFLWESLTLRVTADGSVPVQFALDPRAVWGDVPFTGLRVGPDGFFYQLRSDIGTGVTIARYFLGATQTTPPPSSPSPTTPAGTSPPTSAGTSPPTASSPPTPSPTIAPSSAPPSSPAAVPSTSDAGGSASAELIAGITLVGLAVVGLGGWWVWRRRTTGTTGTTAPPVPPDGPANDTSEPDDAAAGDDGA